jgi:hypothetical protein
MFSTWLLTNQKDCLAGDLSITYECDEFAFYAEYSGENSKTATGRNSKLLVFIDGYIMPRKAHYTKYSHLSMPDLLLTLYDEYRGEFIKYVKGMFNIVIIENNSFTVFNDRAGIKKFFYTLTENQFIITSSLKHISNNRNLRIDANSIAMFSLMEHFIDGATLFDNTHFSTPAMNISFHDGIERNTYWDSGDLAEMEMRDYSFEHIAESFKSILENYLQYFKPKQVAVTLTGGHDTRIIVSALANLGADFRVFSFGNPSSFDGIVARQISEILNVAHSNHFVYNPSTDWFTAKANQLLPLGSSLINIHRAHRLDAIQDEITHNPDVEMLLVGFMGGDYVRGINLDDYITPKLVRLWWHSNEDKATLVRNLLSERYIDSGMFDVDQILEVLSNQRYLNNTDQKKNEYYLNQDLIGAIHDAQDINIFSAHVKYVVDLFIDIDFLEMLFSSRHNMLLKDHTSLNPMKRLHDPELACNLINLMSPQLNSIAFSKNYSPEEFLGNKLVYLSKRVLRRLLPHEYPASFPYESWFRECASQATAELDHGIRRYYDYASLLHALQHDHHPSNEGYWHRFTNPINLSMISRYYASSSESM